TQKVRDIILEADKQIREAASEFPDSASKTRFLAAVDKAKDNFLIALEDITDNPPCLLFASNESYNIAFYNIMLYLYSYISCASRLCANQGCALFWSIMRE
ncbi:MAG: hypothetical protein WBF33_09385, partial [Candidatus Nitrosopolaris sp.]